MTQKMLSINRSVLFDDVPVLSSAFLFASLDRLEHFCSNPSIHLPHDFAIHAQCLAPTKKPNSRPFSPLQDNQPLPANEHQTQIVGRGVMWHWQTKFLTVYMYHNRTMIWMARISMDDLGIWKCATPALICNSSIKTFRCSICWSIQKTSARFAFFGR